MTAKEALGMLDRSGTNLVEPYETMVLETLKKLLENDIIKDKLLILYRKALNNLEQANDMDEVKRILERTLT